MPDTKTYVGHTGDESSTKWLTIGEAAKYMHLSVSSMRRYDKSGVLPAARTPGGQRRWLASDLDAWLHSSESAA